MKKIRFIKEYRAIGDFGMPGKAIIARSLIGDTADNLDDEDAQWLIDNGFAEKVKEEWPRYDDRYWYVLFDGFATRNDIDDIFFLNNLKTIGNVFKTRVSAQRFINYLEAVETVRHDEGFMKYDKIQGEVWELRRAYLDSEELFTAHKVESEFLHHLGAFYFDTEEHAIASSKKHPKEWGTIMNYDWSKGEDKEDEN